jgi:hypothetical protein
MAALSIQVPYPIFYNRDGQPLDNGNVYIGVANLDPVTNPQQVYYDDALTLTASQPLITSNGYVYRNGTPTTLYVDASYSLRVQDANGTTVYNVAEVDKTLPAIQVAESMAELRLISTGQLVTMSGYYTQGDGGGGTFFWDGTSTATDDGGLVINPTGNVGAGRWLRIVDGMVSVLAFGAKRNAAFDNTAIYVKALAAEVPLLFPSGTYLGNMVIIRDYVQIEGEQYRETILSPYTAANPVILIDGDATGYGRALQKTYLTNFSIVGSANAGDGIKVNGTSNNNGCDYMNWSQLFIFNCRYGINIAGRSIWNRFDDIECYGNIDGFHAETDQACNVWSVTALRTVFNKRHGVFLKSIDTTTGGFFSLAFDILESEFNGTDIAQAVSYGVYLENVDEVSIGSLYVEANGAALTSGNGYGVRLAGAHVRGLTIGTIIALDHKYPFYADGFKKTGFINFIRSNVINGGVAGVTLDTSFEATDGRIDFGTVYGAPISRLFDANGNYGSGRTIISPPNYTTAATATSSGLDFSYIDRITVNTAAGAATPATVSGLQPGSQISIFALGANTVTVPAGAMLFGVANVIPANTLRKFEASGFPTPGKLIPFG